MTSFWHYTLGHRVLDILEDGQLNRAWVGVPKHERRAVWFTRRSTWEPLASPLLPHRWATIEETVTDCGALARIEVGADVARHTWATHRQRSGLDPREADLLEASADELGDDTSDWRVSYHDVPVRRFLRIEKSINGVDWTLVRGPDSADAGEFSLFDGEVRAALRRSGLTHLIRSHGRVA